jgi:hypothetical protein
MLMIMDHQGLHRYQLDPVSGRAETALFLNQHQIRFLSLDTGVARDVSIDDWPLENGDWSADGKAFFMQSVTSKDTQVISRRQ